MKPDFLKELLDSISEKVRKETAREIYKAVIDQCFMAKFDQWRFKNWLREKYDVEVEK